MANPFFSKQGAGGQTRSDNIKISKSELRFGPLAISRVNTPPPMDYGRPGDLVLIDSTDGPSDQLQSDQTPDVVGIWMKIPLTNDIMPQGNSIIGRINGVAKAGDVIKINGVDVVLQAPYDATQFSVDVTMANIADIEARVLGGAILITNTTGGDIQVADVMGYGTMSLGVYSQFGMDRNNANGIWVPLAFAANSGGSVGNHAQQYLTLVDEPSLPNSRTLAKGTGIELIDTNTKLVIQQNIKDIPLLVDPIVPSSSIAMHDANTNAIKQVKMEDFKEYITDESVKKRVVDFDTSPLTLLDIPLPEGATVRKVTLTINTVFPDTAEISIGDGADNSSLMGCDDNDPTEINTYETTTVKRYTIPTQLVVRISGNPTFGNGRVIIDFV